MFLRLAYRLVGGTSGPKPVASLREITVPLCLQHLPHRTSARTLLEFADKTILPGSKIYTDDNAAYHDLPNIFNGFSHEAVRHTAGEYVKGKAHTNGVESFWALLKRGYDGTFHHVSAKHLARYVAEFAGRHNIRDLDTIAQMAWIVRAMVGKKLPWEVLTS